MAHPARSGVYLPGCPGSRISARRGDLLAFTGAVSRGGRVTAVFGEQPAATGNHLGCSPSTDDDWRNLTANLYARLTAARVQIGFARGLLKPYVEQGLHLPDDAAAGLLDELDKAERALAGAYGA